MSFLHRAWSRLRVASPLKPFRRGMGHGACKYGGRRHVARLSALAALLATSVSLVASTASATSTSDTPKPSAPTSVSVSATGTTITVSWLSGGNGVGGTCATTNWLVHVATVVNKPPTLVAKGYAKSRYSDDNIGKISFTAADEDTGIMSFTVAGLTPATRHRVDLYAYGESCDEHSSPAVINYIATTADDTDDVATGTLTISSSDASVTEGDSGETELDFTVTLSGSPSSRVVVSATLYGVGLGSKKSDLSFVPTAKGGRKAAGQDFVRFKDQEVVFDANASGAALSQTVTVKVLGDMVDESDETLALWLSDLTTEAANVAFAGGGDTLEVTGTITDDDAPSDTGHEISVADVTVTEGDDGETDLDFTITLSGTPSHQVEVRAAIYGLGLGSLRNGLRVSPTARGGAKVADRDFTNIDSFDVIFAANASGAGLSKKVTVKVKGDTDLESDETLVLRLNNLRSEDRRVHFGGVDGDSKIQLQAIGTITNDD